VWADIASTTGLTYTDPGLWNGTPYDFRVVAHNVAGLGAPSTVVQAVPFTSPGAPMKLTATSGKDWINLTWNPPLGDGGRPVQGYWIYRSTSLNGTYSSIKYTQTLSYLETPLAPGTAYFYYVMACNVAGCGTPSNKVSANVPTLPSKPGACQATQLYGPGSDWLRVQWTLPVNNGGAPILDYSVQIGDWDFSPVYKSAQPLPNPTVTDIYLPLSTGGYYSDLDKAYYYNVRVAARNAAGVGQWCVAYNVAMFE